MFLAVRPRLLDLNIEVSWSCAGVVRATRVADVEHTMLGMSLAEGRRLAALDIE